MDMQRNHKIDDVTDEMGFGL